MFIYLWKRLDMGYVGKWHGSLNGLMNRYKRDVEKKATKKNKKRYIINAMRKYGIDNFEFIIIQYCKTPKRLKFMEKYWIKKLGTLAPNGYNMTKGGDGGPIGFLSYWKNKHRSKETKNKLSKFFKGRKTRPRTEKEIKKSRKIMKRLWKDPDFIKKRTGKNAFWFNKKSPMRNKKNKGVTKALKKRWEDPIFRKKMQNLQMKRWRKFRRDNAKTSIR